MAALAATASAGNDLRYGRYLEIDGTKSPSGRYAVAWGLKDGRMMPVSEMGLLFHRLDADEVRNYIVDRRKKRIVSTLNTRFFASGDYVKNHATLTVSWHPQSKAALVVEDGKWGTQKVDLVRGSNFRVTSVEDEVMAGIRQYVNHRRMRPEVRLGDFRWTGTTSMEFSATTEYPKSWHRPSEQQFIADWGRGRLEVTPNLVCPL